MGNAVCAKCHADPRPPLRRVQCACGQTAGGQRQVMIPPAPLPPCPDRAVCFTQHLLPHPRCPLPYLPRPRSVLYAAPERRPPQPRRVAGGRRHRVHRLCARPAVRHRAAAGRPRGRAAAGAVRYGAGWAVGCFAQVGCCARGLPAARQSHSCWAPSWGRCCGVRAGGGWVVDQLLVGCLQLAVALGIRSPRPQCLCTPVDRGRWMGRLVGCRVVQQGPPSQRTGRARCPRGCTLYLPRTAAVPPAPLASRLCQHLRPAGSRLAAQRRALPTNQGGAVLHMRFKL